MSSADYADDLTIFADTPAQAESLMHCLEQAARGMRLNENAYKSEFMYCKQEGAISTLIGWPFKYVDQFTYLGS